MYPVALEALSGPWAVFVFAGYPVNTSCFRSEPLAMRAKWRKKRMRRLKRKRRKMRARSEKKNKTPTYPMKMMSNLPILFDTL